jgi:FixJ family two-component response regulator
MGNVGNRTVCVVEDEALLRMDAVLLLEEAGFEVKEFAAVEKAMAFLVRGSAKKAFVISGLFQHEGTRLRSSPVIKTA